MCLCRTDTAAVKSLIQIGRCEGREQTGWRLMKEEWRRMGSDGPFYVYGLWGHGPYDKFLNRQEQPDIYIFPKHRNVKSPSRDALACTENHTVVSGPDWGYFACIFVWYSDSVASRSFFNVVSENPGLQLRTDWLRVCSVFSLPHYQG